jgi:hypothetical protein
MNLFWFVFWGFLGQILEKIDSVMNQKWHKRQLNRLWSIPLNSFCHK